MNSTLYKDPETVHNLNMKAVVRETGIKADTLRAWERRYGIPDPDRSGGGHRLYSERDVRILLWLKARQDEGLTIKLAVEQWRQLEREGGDPLAHPQPAVFPAGMQGAATLEALRGKWVEACRSFDEAEAELALSTAFAMFRPEVVCIDLITSGLAQIGELWASGELTVQQEHFASEMARRKLETLIAASPAPVRPGKVLVLCPPGEEHSFIPLLLTFLLRQSGRAVVFLGANVPADALAVSVRTLKPVLVILSATQLATAASMLELLQVLREENVLSAFGGSVFSRVPRFIPGIPAHYLGDDLNDVASRVEKLIAHRPAPPRMQKNPALREAAEQFAEKMDTIEQLVMQRLQADGSRYGTVAALNRFMSEHILAVLALETEELGELYRPQFLEFLRISGFGVDIPENYLDVYIESLVRVLGQDARISRVFLPLHS